MSQEVVFDMDAVLEIVVRLSQESIDKYPKQTEAQRVAYLEALMDVMTALQRKANAVVGPGHQPIITFDKPGH